MARMRDPNRDKAHEIWIQHNGQITNREIAKILDVDEKKIAVWKQRDGWNVVQQKTNNVVQQKKKQGGQPGNRGNPNPKTKFAKRNKAAEKHGFLSKYLPKESMDIIEGIKNKSPADMIWDHIMIQYAAIIRAQKIMFVEDKDELIKELKRRKESYSPNGGSSEEEEWEFQFAWDRHATFMNAQSRAITELRTALRQFDEMAHIDDERRLKLEGMQLGVEKTKAEIEKLQGNKDGTDDWITALKDVAEKRKQVKTDE